MAYGDVGTGKVFSRGFMAPLDVHNKIKQKWPFSQSQQKGTSIAEEVGARPKPIMSFSSDKRLGQIF